MYHNYLYRWYRLSSIQSTHYCRYKYFHEAHSAGALPVGYVHPLAIAILQEMGIDISHHESKPLSLYMYEPWDFIITVCDNAKEACPILPGYIVNAHWGFDDPAGYKGTDDQKYRYFVTTATEIEFRIRLFLDLPENAPLAEYQDAIHHIGTLQNGDVPSFKFS